MRIRSIARFRLVSSFLLSLIAATPAVADDAGGFQLRSLSAEPATPQVLTAGQPVVLEYSGVWHSSCVPTAMALQGTGRQRVLRLTVPPPGQGCLAATQPFALQLGAVSFDEHLVGLIHVVAVQTDSGWISEHELVVRAAHPGPETPSVAAFSVGGAWYDPARSGSGLLLQQRRSGAQDTVAGGWFTFTPTGAPRWHLLVAERWATPLMVEGLVYEATGEPFGCTAQSPNPDCDFAPANRSDIEAVGLFTLSFESPERATLTFVQPGNPTLNWVPGTPIPLKKLM